MASFAKTFTGNFCHMHSSNWGSVELTIRRQKRSKYDFILEKKTNCVRHVILYEGEYEKKEVPYNNKKICYR
jgi:hypothetical protein